MCWEGKAGWEWCRVSWKGKGEGKVVRWRHGWLWGGREETLLLGGHLWWGESPVPSSRVSLVPGAYLLKTLNYMGMGPRMGVCRV